MAGWTRFICRIVPIRRICPMPCGLTRGPAPADCLHVGDSLTEDVEGARSAGVFPVLLDRKGKAQAGCPTIRSLAELPDLLG